MFLTKVGMLISLITHILLVKDNCFEKRTYEQEAGLKIAEDYFKDKYASCYWSERMRKTFFKSSRKQMIRFDAAVEYDLKGNAVTQKTYIPNISLEFEYTEFVMLIKSKYLDTAHSKIYLQ